MTDTTLGHAKAILKKFNGNMEQATDAWFTNQSQFDNLKTDSRSDP